MTVNLSKAMGDVDSGNANEDSEDVNKEVPANCVLRALVIKNNKYALSSHLYLNPDTVDDKGINNWTALHHAAFLSENDSHLEVINVLLKYNANPNAKDENGKTPLHLLLQHPRVNTDTARSLIRCGAQIGLKDNSGQRALHLAAINNNLIMLELFLSFDADIHAKNKRRHTPLSEAVRHSQNDSHMEVCKMLLVKGANPRSKNKNGTTPLEAAAADDNVNKQIFNLLKLFDYEFDDEYLENFEKYSPLHFAEKHNNFEAMKIIFTHDNEFNKNINIVNDRLRTAVQNSKDNSHLEICKILLSKNANVNLITNPSEGSLLHLLLNRKIQNNEILKLFLDHKADINVKNIDGHTPLHLAVISKNVKAVELLFSHGADPNSKNAGDLRPLHLVAELSNEDNYLDICKTLLSHKNINVNAITEFGDTPLHLLVNEKSNDKILYLLLQSKAKENIKNFDGDTALHCAARNNNLKAINHFLNNKTVSVNETNNDFWTPLHCAAYSSQNDSHLEVCKKLLYWKANLNALTCLKYTPLKLLSVLGRSNPKITALFTEHINFAKKKMIFDQKLPKKIVIQKVLKKIDLNKKCSGEVDERSNNKENNIKHVDWVQLCLLAQGKKPMEIE